MQFTFNLLFVSRYHILKAETIKDIQFHFSDIFNNNLMHAFSNASTECLFIFQEGNVLILAQCMIVSIHGHMLFNLYCACLILHAAITFSVWAHFSS